MKRVFTAACLLAFFTILGFVAATPARGSSTASTYTAPAVPAVTFVSPREASAGGVGPGRIGATSLDGSVNILAHVDQSIETEFNTSFYGGFNQAELDSAVSIGNQTARHGADGRVVGVWFHGNSDGSADIIGAEKVPGTGNSSWNVVGIPGSRDTFKVTDSAVQPGTNRLWAMWGRNNVGARVAYSDDGVNWSNVENVPGPFSSNAANFAIGVTTGGVVMVSWFERSPQDDLLVQVRAANGVWGPVTDIAPLPGQAYGARMQGDYTGGMRVIWDQVDGRQRDPWYREWTPAGGWGPLVQLVNTSGDTSGGSFGLGVDQSGVAHIVYSDDSIITSVQQSYYIEGQGTSFTRPVPIFPQFGNVNGRFPDIDVNTYAGQTYAHIVVNNNRTGSFVNYYTYATLAPPGPPTATPTATSSPTAVASPTPCGSFSDVHQTDYFYTPVNYLVSRGIVSGYSDCTFRPYNPTTRSQMVKIIVLAFNVPPYVPPLGGNTFHDVLPDNNFFTVIEAAAHAGIVSGYTCGRPGQPCDQFNRAYFLPYANVTRGQLSKIVVIAAQWTVINPPNPTFSDVQPNSTFYTVIETAVCHGVVSGYNDGTFRPNNNATRGQIAKIVYLALTGNVVCQPTPTATSTPVPTSTPTATATNTPLPTNTATVTATAVPPTVTSTAVPPTVTSTAVVPTVTATAVPPTVTSTAVVPTVTATAVPPTVTVTVTIPPPRR
ncbi:MAG: S-layer homology domain-containing protein [Chloroflexia bacterium]